MLTQIVCWQIYQGFLFIQPMILGATRSFIRKNISFTGMIAFIVVVQTLFD